MGEQRKTKRHPLSRVFESEFKERIFQTPAVAEFAWNLTLIGGLNNVDHIRNLKIQGIQILMFDYTIQIIYINMRSHH